jgi:hypothetical protein
VSRSTSEPLRHAQRWIASRTAPAHRLLLQPDALWDAGRRGAAAPVRHAGLAAWCEAHPGAACELLLSGRLLHSVVCESGLPLDDDAATQAYVRQLLTHYHGAAAQRWPVAAWHSGGRRGGCALHGAELAEWQRLAAQHAVHIRSARPWWSLLLPRVLQAAPELARVPHASLLVVEGPWVTRVGLGNGACDAIQNHRLDAPSVAALDELAQNIAAGDASVPLAIGHGLDTATPQHLRPLAPLHGAPPVAWTA